MPPITACGSSLARLCFCFFRFVRLCWIASTLFLPVYCRAGVSKLGSSCCPPSLCQAWLSAERPCQGDILSHHVLTHFWPGLAKAFAAQFSGAKAFQAIFYCFNLSVSWWLVCRVAWRGVSLYKQGFTYMLALHEQRNGVIINSYNLFLAWQCGPLKKRAQTNETRLHFIHTSYSDRSPQGRFNIKKAI